jgi:hypothetical protein
LGRGKKNQGRGKKNTSRGKKNSVLFFSFFGIKCPMRSFGPKITVYSNASVHLLLSDPRGQGNTRLPARLHFQPVLCRRPGRVRATGQMDNSTAGRIISERGGWFISSQFTPIILPFLRLYSITLLNNTW